jgi:hypothetical protein
MSHQYLPQQPQFHFPPPSLPSTSTNRFIYVKHNFVNPNPNPTVRVLVNPHFKKKVYVNPQFTGNVSKTHVNPAHNAKPKIHVNPNVLKNFATSVKSVPKVEPVLESKSTTVISTRNKLVRVPYNPADRVVRKRRSSVHTKYKIVRTGSVSRFKLDKRKSVSSPGVRSAKKKYVYVNRFLSMGVVAKNVLLRKNASLGKPGFVNINGILYKKSPNSLKKASDSPKPASSKYKIARKEAKQRVSSSNPRRSVVKRFKLIRSRKQSRVAPNKLRKCNIPCPVFRKFGRCRGKSDGTCIKLHNPDQVVLCTRFLQGACLDQNCLLSHKVSDEKVPTCKYYLDGLCSRDGCPYLHVKISPKADVCRDFVEGFCKKGAQCDKRHQFLCPDFEKTKTCAKRRCPYPHGNTVRKNTKVLNAVAKKCSTKKDKARRVAEPENGRYYKDSHVESGESGRQESVVKAVSRERPKLGDLPAFIPFFETT